MPFEIPRLQEEEEVRAGLWCARGAVATRSERSETQSCSYKSISGAPAPWFLPQLLLGLAAEGQNQAKTKPGLVVTRLVFGVRHAKWLPGGGGKLAFSSGVPRCGVLLRSYSLEERPNPRTIKGSFPSFLLARFGVCVCWGDIEG